MRVLISTSNFPVQIKSCASHLSCMCLYGGVYLASCSLWWRHKILFWFSSLIFQYHTCCSKGHFLCSIYLVRLMRFVFVFCFFLIAIVWLCWCVSILRNFMSLFSHFVGDYLSISASIRRILNSEDNKWRIFVVVVVHSHEFQSNILLSNEMTLFLTVIDQYRTKDKISIYLCRMSILLIRANVYTSFSHDMHHFSRVFSYSSPPDSHDV